MLVSLFFLNTEADFSRIGWKREECRGGGGGGGKGGAKESQEL